MISRYIHYISILVLLTAFTACQKSQVKSNETLVVSSEDEPTTLDPRLVRDLGNATIIHALYEGLTRLNEEGDPILALAESVSIDADQKKYTFRLKKSAWSDGSPVTAYDFEQTWKSILDPHFPAPNAYQLYVIEGAKEAKEGRLPIEKIGVKAIDERTLVVYLSHPTPYFLSLTASYFYYPAHDQIRKKTTTANAQTNQVISNGPFKLDTWARRNQLTIIKNPYYWDAKSVHLNKIAFVMVDNPTALSMFERHELDWVGSPLSTLPTDALASLKQQDLLSVKPAAGIYLLRYQVENSPLDQSKIRQALTLAINRQNLIEHVLQGNQIPAKGLIPPSFLHCPAHFRDHDIDRAQKLLKEALEDMHLSKDRLPTITISYANGERAHKTAQVIQQQWKENLGIDVQLQSYESKTFYERLKNKDYQVTIGSWFADFYDPISFLDVFKHKDNGTNNTGWEDPEYIQLLSLSCETPHPTNRDNFLVEAEKVLLEKMPIAPLYYGSYNYLKRPDVQGVYFSELGYLDFKHASMQRE